MTADEDFESALPSEHLSVILMVGAEVDIDPTSSVEMEQYFSSLLRDFESERRGPAELPEWLRLRLRRDFRSIEEQPQWIQNPAWPILGGSPMVFVGQLDVPASAGLFHDESSFYLFFDPKSGESRTVIQLA